MEKLIDAFCNWHPLGQGFFTTFCLVSVLVFFYSLGELFVILFRGWPPIECEEEEEEEEE